MSLSIQFNIDGTDYDGNTELEYKKLGDAVTLSAFADITPSIYEWTLLDKPKGSIAALSDTNIASPTFEHKPDIAGTYLVRCVINKGIAGQQTVEQYLSFLTEHTELRIPAKGEIIQSGRGYVESYNQAVKKLANASARGITMICKNNTGGSLAHGKAVLMTGIDLVTNPNETKLNVSLANIADLASINDALAMVGISLGDPENMKAVADGEDVLVAFTPCTVTGVPITGSTPGSYPVDVSLNSTAGAIEYGSDSKIGVALSDTTVKLYHGIGGGSGSINEYSDDSFRIKDNTDGTKKISFEAGEIATGTTRTVTVQDADSIIITTDQHDKLKADFQAYDAIVGPSNCDYTSIATAMSTEPTYSKILITQATYTETNTMSPKNGQIICADNITTNDAGLNFGDGINDTFFRGKWNLNYNAKHPLVTHSNSYNNNAENCEIHITPDITATGMYCARLYGSRQRFNLSFKEPTLDFSTYDDFAAIVLQGLVNSFIKVHIENFNCLTASKQYLKGIWLLSNASYNQIECLIRQVTLAGTSNAIGINIESGSNYNNFSGVVKDCDDNLLDYGSGNVFSGVIS